jgi:hypothetical protein
MKARAHDLLIEPAGTLYHGLIDFALSCCPLALLVVRPEMELADGGRRVLASLDPFLESRVKSSRWPGTELFDGEAELFYFRLEPGSAELLKAATDRLYGWCQPDLPEDLCFLHADREPWLATISHENDGFFRLGDWERARLLHALPALKVTPSEE